MKEITRKMYERVVGMSCEKPVRGPLVVVESFPTEVDYLYTVWWNLANYLEWDNPMLQSSNGRSDIELLHDEISVLLRDSKFDMQPTLGRSIRVALEDKIRV